MSHLPISIISSNGVILFVPNANTQAEQRLDIFKTDDSPTANSPLTDGSFAWRRSNEVSTRSCPELKITVSSPWNPCLPETSITGQRVSQSPACNTRHPATSFRRWPDPAPLYKKKGHLCLTTVKVLAPIFTLTNKLT
ncbi:hypothetical protein E2P81_ATG05180 [Venturia nashicola]|nr:hypothetical protein E2P81_ATG05180 [Venturia nashicola]